jgi:hypothetical protein
VRARGLAFRPRRAFDAAAFQFGKHGRVLDRGGIDLADAGLFGGHFSCPEKFISRDGVCQEAIRIEAAGNRNGTFD